MRNTLFVAALLALAACGEETDDRPATAGYLVPAVFRPSCGTAACHSSATARSGVILDTLVGACAVQDLTFFITGDPSVTRMPLDSPLPDADILLILEWQDTGRPGCP